MASATQPSTSRRREQGARTRDRVLEVATELIARRGYSGTTISAISKASGVMPASIYWHFESKEGLLAAVIERAADAWFTGAMHAVESAEMAGDRENPKSAGFEYVFQEQPEFYRVLLMVSLERRESDDLSLDAVRRIRARLKQYLAEGLEDRIPVEDDATRRDICARLAEIGSALLDGFFVAHQIDGAAPDHLAQRFEQFAFAMGLARQAFIDEAAGRPVLRDAGDPPAARRALRGLAPARDEVES